jgi:hypothetical protein
MPIIKKETQTIMHVNEHLANTHMSFLLVLVSALGSIAGSEFIDVIIN